MEQLLPLARKIAARLIERHQTIAVAEGSCGGLMSAALLAVPGASAYFRGGGVIYTAAARGALLDIGSAEMTGMRAASEPYAALLAQRVRERLGATWGLAELGGRTDRQSLWRPGRACVPGGVRPRGAHPDGANRK